MIKIDDITFRFNDLKLEFPIKKRKKFSSAYKRGVYHGWNAASYNSHGVPQRLEQNVEINPEEVIHLEIWQYSQSDFEIITLSS